MPCLPCLLHCCSSVTFVFIISIGLYYYLQFYLDTFFFPMVVMVSHGIGTPVNILRVDWTNSDRLFWSQLLGVSHLRVGQLRVQEYVFDPLFWNTLLIHITAVLEQTQVQLTWSLSCIRPHRSADHICHSQSRTTGRTDLLMSMLISTLTSMFDHCVDVHVWRPCWHPCLMPLWMPMFDVYVWRPC